MYNLCIINKNILFVYKIYIGLVTCFNLWVYCVTYIMSNYSITIFNLIQPNHIILIVLVWFFIIDV